MSTLAKQLINKDFSGHSVNPLEVSRFSPADIRVAIQALMGEERIDLAYALGDAGLALYPDSEDMLAVTSLLAVMAQDLPQVLALSGGAALQIRAFGLKLRRSVGITGTQADQPQLNFFERQGLVGDREEVLQRSSCSRLGGLNGMGHMG